MTRHEANIALTEALRAIQPERLADIVIAAKKIIREAGEIDFMTAATKALADQLHEAEHKASLAIQRTDKLRSAIQS